MLVYIMHFIKVELPTQERKMDYSTTGLAFRNKIRNNLQPLK